MYAVLAVSSIYFCYFLSTFKLSHFCCLSTMVNACFKGKHIQSNLNSSNTDGSFTMANLNSFESPYEIHPMAPENN